MTVLSAQVKRKALPVHAKAPALTKADAPVPTETGNKQRKRPGVAMVAAAKKRKEAVQTDQVAWDIDM